MLAILKTSLEGIGQMIIGMTSWIFLMRILADIESETVAGATIALRIMLFCMMPAWGLSNAATTLVGQNLGAGDAARAEAAIWKIGKYNMFFLLLVSAFFFIFSETLVGFFTDTSQVIAVGSKWLEILSYSFFVYGWWMVATQAFNGAGDTTTPTKINFVFFWLVQIPLAYLLAINQSWGYSGIFWAFFFRNQCGYIHSLAFYTGQLETSKV